MKFETFKDKLCDIIAMEMGEGYEVCAREVTKNNGVVLTGIMAKKHDSNISPTLYINEHYNKDVKEEDLTEMGRAFAEHLRQAIVPDIDVIEDLLEYDRIRDHIAIKLVNTRKNKDMLDNVPSREFLNLSICYYFGMDKAFEQSDQMTQRATVLIGNALMEKWGIDEESLYEAAISNMKKAHPDKVISMQDMLKSRIDSLTAGISMYILTNDINLFGASAILYGDGIKDLADRLDSDIIILPSSVHEVILLPSNEPKKDADDLLNIVCEVNKNEVRDEDILADSVYLYDRASKSISLLCQKGEN